MGDEPGATRNAQKMLIQRLLERPVAIRVGEERAIFIASDALRGVLRKRRVVMVGKHQTQAGQMHDVGIGKPAFRPLLAQGQELLGEPRCAGPPLGLDDGQDVCQLPVRFDVFTGGAGGAFVPVVPDP